MLPSSQLMGLSSLYTKGSMILLLLDYTVGLLMNFCLLNVQTSQAKVVTDSPSGG